MSKQHIEELIQKSINALQQSGVLPAEVPSFQIDTTKNKEHGDFACNAAMVLAKIAKKNPKEIAALLIQHLPPSDYIKKVDIAGPGFINFFLSPHALYQTIKNILDKKEKYGQMNLGQGQRILVEYVSSNPTGPLHVGHGRHAAYGAVVSDLLETIGYQVHREYYVNDAGRQMDILAVSTWLRYLALCGETIIIPSNAYQGEYIIDIAKILQAQQQNELYISAEKIFSGLPADAPQGGDKEIYIDAVIVRAKTLLTASQYETVFDLTLKTILKDIHDDLAEFGVHFQEWFSERIFVKSGIVDRLIQQLKNKNLAYENEGALWFRSTNFGDEKDRVLERSNGQRTYFANDFAYHIHKFERGFSTAIDIFGADHHGYIPRMKAALQACDIAPEKLTYLLLQFVTLYRGNQQVQMSTRSGSFVTLRELREEVGNDAARFFYVMRKCEQHVDFDLDLAKSQSNENPVYYIQYAHARICSVFRQLTEKQLSYQTSTELHLLTEPTEIQLMGTLGLYQDIIKNAALQHEPHLLCHYLRELAADFHGYYNCVSFLISEEPLRNARLSLISATRQILINGLKLLGVSQPESM